MTVRELLELAAKAAGYYVEAYLDNGGIVCRDTFDVRCFNWNPLTDDGDALRLAVKLGLWLHIGKCHIAIEGTRIEESACSDPYAATRRAIVRAAAEIGKGMK